ncbi:hypothetical protein ZIOFF_071285 [Zingiber officinale]|uniref:Uncharacterized protein n=1 Tax=Zingiber officinale TaxID=94328 RepID=A0A8J5EQD6_ZINOF|nr:hypothetical protein ZIOFF_071285 [Zingiber officinale]
MDRCSWLWRRKSSEKSPGVTESSGFASSERHSSEQMPQGGILNALYIYHSHDIPRGLLATTFLLVVFNCLSSFQIYSMPVFDSFEVALPFLSSLAGILGGLTLPQFVGIMESKTWIWNRKSTGKNIEKGKTLELEKSVENLNEQLSSVRSESNAKDDLLAKQAKVAEEAISWSATAGPYSRQAGRHRQPPQAPARDRNGVICPCSLLAAGRAPQAHAHDWPQARCRKPVLATGRRPGVAGPCSRLVAGRAPQARAHGWAQASARGWQQARARV